MSIPTRGVTRPALHTVTHGVQRGLVTDPLSNKGVPLTQLDWDAVFLQAGLSTKTVAHSWGFQDASGNIVATVGTNLAATGLAYQQGVSGWTRTGAAFTDNSTDSALHGAGVGINPATTSCLWLGYVDLTIDPAALRTIFGAGGAAAATELTCRHAGGHTLNVKVAGVSTNGTADPASGGVRPIGLVYNRTAGTVMVFSDQEKLSGTYNAGVTDGVKGFGATLANTIGMTVLWGAAFAGTNAELTSTQIKAVLQALGWTIPWS